MVALAPKGLEIPIPYVLRNRLGIPKQYTTIKKKLNRVDAAGACHFCVIGVS